MHRNADLQDVEVSDKFHELCSKYPQIFTYVSGEFGHTDLVTMDMDMGGSLPISQKPYSLPLKHISLFVVFLLGLVP